jgi:glucosamine 6-phosphate synthetase-like amidotransferase/phosphosugar isomerase protein
MLRASSAVADYFTDARNSKAFLTPICLRCAPVHHGEAFMCGIVGAVAQRNIVPVLIEGLRRLEYRGYDSCGVAVHADGALKRARSVARVAELDAQAADLAAFTGIAHTRWATHGAPSTANAHPHFSSGPAKSARSARVALVHNGIIENHEELRAKLVTAGYAFESQTDTEVIAHLIDSLYDGDLFDAVQHAVRQLRGAYAIAVFCRDEPHRVVGAREGSPVVVGIGDEENFLASDAMALAGTTDQIIYLRTATSSTCSSRASGSSTARGARSRARYAPCRRGSAPSSSARTGISCRRRSSSSRARSATRSDRSRQSSRRSSAPALRTCCRASTAC